MQDYLWFTFNFGPECFGVVFKTGKNVVTRAATHFGDPDHECPGL